MASTNKTTHYELSQYVSSDKPTYLVDYNGDMAKIDTAINAAKTTADSASTAATNAATDAATAQGTANTAVTNAATAQTTADGANTKIGTMANLTTSEKTNLVGAINEVNDKEFVIDSMSGNETTKAPSVYSTKQALSVGKTYSTSEYDTGKKWLNGETIYGRVIDAGSLPNNSGKTIATGFLPSEYLVTNLYGICQANSVGVFPIPRASATQVSGDIDLYITSNGEIDIQTGSDRTNLTGYVFIEYVKK